MPGRARRAGRLPDRPRPLHRRAAAGADQERRAAHATSTALRATRASALALARAVVRAKISNQRTLLMRSPAIATTGGAGRARPAAAATSRPPATWPSCWPAWTASPTPPCCWAPKARPPPVLQPVQPHAQVPGSRPQFRFQDPQPPPAADPVNALLSFAYALLAQGLLLRRLHGRLRPVPTASSTPAATASRPSPWT